MANVNVERAMKAQSWSRGVALLFILPWRYMAVGNQKHAPTALPPGRRPGTRGTEGWV
jgi:hypothetical protein